LEAKAQETEPSAPAVADSRYDCIVKFAVTLAIASARVRAVGVIDVGEQATLQTQWLKAYPAAGTATMLNCVA
jgi:hypothetical protein